MMSSRGNGNSTFSVLGTDLVITGNIKAGADLHVDGEVHGDISCAVEAESARLAGRVVGTITVRELVILKTARIEGDVHYDALTIEQGAQVEGRFAHSQPGAASKAKAGGQQASGQQAAAPAAAATPA
jgi:cytoskeletal protein CcmA (bactofilin family)